MIKFSCPACEKRLTVPETLAGKKVKCLGCGQVVGVPAKVAVATPVNADERTLPPAPAPEFDSRRMPPSDVADAGTPPPSSKCDATAGGDRPDTGHDPSLTDFLSPPQADDELGRLGKYRILTVLGHGGMGVVYQAEDPKLKRRVALKAMLPTLAASASAGKRFLLEAQAMAAVEHDHIVRIHQVDEERGVPFLAMEFLKGEPLDERLKREEKLPLAEVLRIGREIAEGLSAAHSTGLIHRDIKPGNVWLEAPRNRVKILDFGLARSAAQDAGLTQQGVIIGTPAYMAPEQGRGDAIDARSDLFSLGVVLYRLCSGKQPFGGRDTVSTLMSVAVDEPAAPLTLNPDLPPELSDLVMQLLKKDPNQRPASAGVVVKVLQRLEKRLTREQDDEEGTVALATTPRKRAAAPRGRSRLPLLIAAAVLLVGLIGVGAWALIRIQSEQGAYVIDTDDPDFAFRVGKGTVTLEDRKTNRKYNLKVLAQNKDTGENELEVAEADGDLAFKTRTFTIKRGEKVALKAWFERKEGIAAHQDPGKVDDAWLKQVAAMPAEKQIEAVAAKLTELNPNFAPERRKGAKATLTHSVEGGVVTRLEISTLNVNDVSPLRALTGLRTLKCPAGSSSSSRRKGQLADLSPLKHLKLTSLDISSTQVSDLSPLKQMNLTILHCAGTEVTNLSPLKDLKLTILDCSHTEVSDLSPLKDMKLTELYCLNTLVSNLSPLKDMPLTILHCTHPKKGAKGTPVTDLSPLKGMPLKDLRCDFKFERDSVILRSIKTLETINAKPVAQFWNDGGLAPAKPIEDAWLKEVAAMPVAKQMEAVLARLEERNPGVAGKVTLTPTIVAGRVAGLSIQGRNVIDIEAVRALAGLTSLICQTTQVADLTPLKDLKLTSLDCRSTQVSDLSPLKDMNLTEVGFYNTKVSDLSPLKNMKLREVNCRGTKVSDLSPLKDMKLTSLSCGGTQVSDLSPLKDMKLTSLECQGTQVSDLSPLKDMILTDLDCANTSVTDLSPLRGMPLKTLRCDFKPERDSEILRSIKTLEKINGKSAKDFWAEVDAKKPKKKP